MVTIWLRALLFVAGGVTAAAGVAYFTGMLDPWLDRQPAAVASAPEVSAPQQPQEDAPAASGEVPLPDDPETTEKQSRLSAPGFDLLRVEPDGSVLIAGKAPAEATVEVMAGDSILAGTVTGAEGDFVVVLDEPLAPGDYVLSLRATTADGDTSTSTETAIVSIPETADGQVLALLEEPGSAAELVTVPEAPAAPDEAPVATDAPDTAGESEPQELAAAEEPAEETVASEEEAAGEEQAAASDAGQPEAAQPQPEAGHNVVVEAVEIEGGTIFVAGSADPGRIVRVYAGAILLGDARVSEGGRFLVEAQRDLPVGSYVIRADLLSADGTVLARAAVPFEREPGESIAAVAVAPEPEAVEEEVAAGSEPAPAPEADEEEIAAAPEAELASEAVEEAEEVATGPEPALEAIAEEVAEELAAEPEAEVAAAPPPAEAAEEPEITAPPLQRVDGAVIIRRGDNLWRISRRVYGKGIRYSTIYLANQDQIRNPNLIWPGQVFTVPQQTEEGEEANLDAVAEQVVAPGQPDNAAQQ